MTLSFVHDQDGESEYGLTALYAPMGMLVIAH